MRVAVAIFLSLVALPSAGAECESGEAYERGLCLYSEGNYREAVRVLEPIASAESEEGAKATYFIARSRMKLGEWEEASDRLIDLFSRSPAFYRLWNCDYLLGVCRERIDRG